MAFFFFFNKLKIWSGCFHFYLILIQMCHWATSILYLTLKGLNDAHYKLLYHRCDTVTIILGVCEDFYLFHPISFVLKWHLKYHFRSSNHSQRSSPITCQLNILLIRLVSIMCVQYSSKGGSILMINTGKIRSMEYSQLCF